MFIIHINCSVCIKTMYLNKKINNNKKKKKKKSFYLILFSISQMKAIQMMHLFTSGILPQI